MPQQETLSLPAAIFININIMLGTGVFINTVILARHVGSLGFAMYLLAGTLIFPLVWCIAKLTSLYNEGNFFTFGKIISPYWGFISTWSYFIGKLGSASLSIHVFNTFLQHVFPTLRVWPPLFLDLSLVGIFVLLNMLNIKTGSKLQYGFVCTKLIPLFFAIGAGFIYFDFINVGLPHAIWEGIPVALPLSLFCCLGFEATCSLSKVIKDSKRNAPRAIFSSFFIVVLLAALYQLLFQASLGASLAEQTNYTGAFPLLANLIAPKAIHILGPFFSTAIAVSALGGAYGIMFTNLWNLYTLGKNVQLPFSKHLLKMNSFNVPTFCVIAEGVICSLYLIFSKGAQIPLQYTATMACIFTYAVSVGALFKKKGSLMSVLGLSTCFMLLGTTLYGFMNTDLTPLFIFSLIMTGGTLLYAYSNGSLWSSRQSSTTPKK